MPIPWLPDQHIFPHPLTTRSEGLLAAGGDLSAERLMLAYRSGIFPWYHESEPLLWWFPDPRCVLVPGDVHCSRSLSKRMRQSVFRITADTAFAQVIRRCAQVPRQGRAGTWIHTEMIDAYTRLHTLGHAHSVEVWLGDELIGGIYGVAAGRLFFGESMFSLVTDASKVALVMLCRYLQGTGFQLLDCQQDTPHMRSMGAILFSASEFWSVIKENLHHPVRAEKWQWIE